MHPELRVATPKHELLQEFTKILHKHDPMGTGSQSEDEYEPEALSILSRFCESALQLADEESAVLTFAAGAIQQTFEFWFGQLPTDSNLEPLMLELVKTYINAFPPDASQVHESQVIG